MPTSFRGLPVHRDAVLKAMAAFDAEYAHPNDYEGWLDNGTYHYAVEHAGRPYPPKHILSRITGIPTADLHGGDPTNHVFQELGFAILTLRQPPTWLPDEELLLLDLYLHLAEQGRPPTSVSHGAPEIVELSNLLRSLPLHCAWTYAPRFRNPTGIHMKLMNLLSLDPSQPAKGLDAASQLDRTTWDTYADNPELVHQRAHAIRQHYQQGQPLPPEEALAPQDDPADTYPEGRLLYRLHRVRERNRTLIQNKKAQAAPHLTCEVCGFDFHTTYGAIGRGYAECHHIKPVSSLQPGETTKLADLAIVCANCHRMLHRPHPNNPTTTPTIEELRAFLDEQRPLD